MIARFEWQRRHTVKIRAADTVVSWRKIMLASSAMLLTAWLIYHHGGRPEWLDAFPPLILESISLLESAAVLTVIFVAVIFWWRARRRWGIANQTLTTDDLYALSPKEFERYVADLFRQRGYAVQMRGRSGDHGVDLELTRKDGRRAVVQCKRYRNAIGPDIVRELFGTMIHERVHHAFLVTTADISDAARQWANDKPMTLIDGATLTLIAEALRRQLPA